MPFDTTFLTPEEDFHVEKAFQQRTVILQMKAESSRFDSKGVSCPDHGLAIEEGMCRAISAEWIVKSASGESFWGWMESNPQARAKCANLGRRELQTTKLQSQIEQSKGYAEAKKKNPSVTPQTYLWGTDPRGYNAVDAEHAGWSQRLIQQETAVANGPRLVADPALTRKVYNSPSEAADKITQTKGYTEFAFYLRDKVTNETTGHACAAEITNRGVSFMDPNYGEIRFPDEQLFQLFLDRHFNTKYGAYQVTKVEFTSYPCAGSNTRSETWAMGTPPPNPDEVEEKKPLPATPKRGITRENGSRDLRQGGSTASSDPLPPLPTSEEKGTS